MRAAPHIPMATVDLVLKCIKFEENVIKAYKNQEEIENKKNNKNNTLTVLGQHRDYFENSKASLNLLMHEDKINDYYFDNETKISLNKLNLGLESFSKDFESSIKIYDINFMYKKVKMHNIFDLINSVNIKVIQTITSRIKGIH